MLPSDVDSCERGFSRYNERCWKGRTRAVCPVATVPKRSRVAGTQLPLLLRAATTAGVEVVVFPSIGERHDAWQAVWTLMQDVSCSSDAPEIVSRKGQEESL